MTLDARRADRIDRLTSATSSLRSPATTGSTSGLERVRVRAKGGTFYGHLVSREGKMVTLLLDEGFRITVPQLQDFRVRIPPGATPVSRRSF